jgi:hypothetical protein
METAERGGRRRKNHAVNLPILLKTVKQPVKHLTRINENEKTALNDETLAKCSTGKGFILFSSCYLLLQVVPTGIEPVSKV